MPTFVLASSKGGAGKTTGSVLVTSELAHLGQKQGFSVTLIDADPNQHSAAWAKKEGCPENLHVMENVTQENMIDAIQTAQERSAYVIVDLEGTASMTVGFAISEADFVLIPCQGSHPDASEAIKTIKMIRSQERALKRKIPYSIFMTRSPAAIVTREFKAIIEQFESQGIPRLSTALVDRVAYKSILSYGGTLYDLPAHVAGKDKAISNCKKFVVDIGKSLKEAVSAEVA